jgi:hypothetical protein
VVVFRFINWRISIGDLSFEKGASLVRNNLLLSTPDNFFKIKESFENLHIEFIEKHKKKYLEDISSYILDSSDLELVLKSSKFTANEKERILGSVQENVILSNAENIKIIVRLVLSNWPFKISNTLTKSILLSDSANTSDRISFFNFTNNQLELDVITEFLNSLEVPYSEIAINGKRPLIDSNPVNLKFCEVLKEREYISSFEKIKESIRISTFRKE